MSTTLHPSNQNGSSSKGLQREKALACKRCQYKKLKCSKTVPCHACQKAKIECEYRQIDRKRRPASQDHVNLLQSRVAWLEEFILDLQNASPAERDSKLLAINLTSSSSGRVTSTSTSAEKQFGSVFYRTSNLQLTPDGTLSFHGPTSIYHTAFDDSACRLSWTDRHRPNQDETFKNAEHVLKHFEIDLDAEIVNQTLLLFFKWQYPNYVFIYRDAFLRDHYGERQEGKYWSRSLLLSICALSSLMLPESEKGDFGRRCHDAALSIAVVADLVRPSITAVQTFLCLAFCEIGLGNLSKAWSFSGIAFRMAQDLGFQKDPETWALVDQLLNTDEDVEIRRRIYWGCYISDKLISLVFGRPVQLLYNEAEVHELATQPDPAFILPWRSVGFNDDAYQQYTDISMIPYIKEQIKLAHIVERTLSLISSESDQNIALRQQNLDSVNQMLLEWRRNLPEWADCKIWDTIDQPMKPSIAAIHLLYNATRIALNFNEASSLESLNRVDQAREACTIAIAEIHSILRRFRKQHGLSNSPLIMIYALAQAIRASKAFGAEEETKGLIRGLSGSAATWKLADMVVSGKL